MADSWRPRAVLFDLDDTLLITREVKWRQHISVARDRFGLDLTEQTLRLHYGKPYLVMLDEIYDHAPMEEIRSAINAVKADYPKLPQPGAPELVRDLIDAGIAVGVVTASTRADALDDLTRGGFPYDDLAILQGADDTEIHKPDPRVFDPALAALAGRGIAREDICYVGDGTVDRDAAVAAGLRFYAVTRGMYGPEAFTGHPVVATTAELRKLLLPRGEGFVGGQA